MSLTGCPDPALATTAELCVERVEQMALLWQMLDGDAAYCANPRLLMITRLLPELRDDPATLHLAALRQTHDRDRLVKLLTSDAHGVAVDPEVRELAAALDALSGRWAELLQGLAAPLGAAYVAMRERAGRLTDTLDPARDMERLTGEREQLIMLFCPSLFLPPPQNGRHSSLIATGDANPTAYLFFGFPLDNDPAQFGINPYWLRGGAWHYPVTRFIERHWKPIATGLAGDRPLVAAMTAALEEHRARVIWPDVIAEHLVLALKCALCRQAGVPDLVHRDFARAQGAAFFDWFVCWTMRIAEESPQFVNEFEKLPMILRDRLDDVLTAATEMESGASSINFAMASRQPRVLVVPDHWDKPLREKISRRWSLVAQTVLGESEWQQRESRTSECLIAFGEIGRDPLVGELLVKAGEGNAQVAGPDDLIVALVPQRRARQPWQLAVAVRAPPLAGSFAAELIMHTFQKSARFSLQDLGMEATQATGF